MQGVLCFLVLGTILHAEDSYQLQIEKDRKETQEFLRSERGPLRLIGRYTLKEGDSRIGSDPESEIPLPRRPSNWEQFIATAAIFPSNRRRMFPCR